MKLKELKDCPHILVQVYSAIICYRKPGKIPEGLTWMQRQTLKLIQLVRALFKKMLYNLQ